MKSVTNPRHQSRILALQKLFEAEFNSNFSFPIQELSEINQTDSEKKLYVDEKYFQHIIDGIKKDKVGIDELITQYAQKRLFEDTSKVDIMILRIAIFELLFSSIKVPIKVVIDESVELAKQFGGNKSFKFINGVLAKICKEKNL